MRTIASYGIVPFVRGQHYEWFVLVILHAKGNHWGFPKGKPDPGEQSLQTACRELKEETGLDMVRVLSEEPLIEHYHFTCRQQRLSKSVYYFPSIVQGALTLQEEEVREAKWLPIKEAQQQLTFQEAKNILLRCDSFLD
jgi:8-oxo-dGTP pyrophosphatase MutT (NUDIX family)